MPKIPRAEQSVTAQPVKMPFSSGDGYEAPGKAMQQLGRAVSSLGPALAGLGEAFDAEASKEAEFNDSLKLAKFDNDVDLDEMKFRSTYQGDGTDYAQQRAQYFQDRATELMPQLSPRGQQRASLYLERKRGTWNQSAYQFERGRKEDTLYSATSDAIDREAGKLAYMFPRESWNAEAAEGIYVPPDEGQIAAKVQEYMAGQDAIINRFPGSYERAVRLKQQARDSIVKFVQTLPPEVQKRVMEQVEATASAEPPAPAPGAPSNIQGQMMRWGGGSNPREMPVYNGERPDYRGKGGPAAIRYNNPGAMWPGPSSKKFGAVDSVTLRDGQGNKIAVFPDAVSGAAAQFDLLERRYTGKTLASAITTWSGGNSSAAYAAKVAAETGLTPATVLTKDMIRDPRIAIPIARSMASMEAGRKEYPLAVEQWRAAHQMAFGGERNDRLATGAANENAPRAPNTIPAEAGGEQRPVQVADASGRVPQSVAPQGGNPASARSVLSYTAEWFREHRPAFDERYRAAVAGMVQEVETLAKQGNVSPRHNMIEREVATLGDPELIRRLTVARGTQSEVAGLKQLPPRVSGDYVNAKRASLGNVMTVEQQENLKLIEGHNSAKAKALADDPLGYGKQVGTLPPFPALTRETFTPDALKERLQLAGINANRFETPLTLFQPDERAWMEEIVKGGGAPLMAMLGTMAQGMGPAMPLAVAEVAKKHPEAVQAGWLLASGVNVDTARAIADGIARRNDPNYKQIGAPEARLGMEKVAQEVLGDVFDGYPQTMKDAVMRAAEIVYETRNRKPQEYNSEMFKTALNEVMGRNEREGRVYGGIYQQSRGLFSSNQGILLPPHVRNDPTAVEKIKFAISSFSPEEMREAGLTPPVYADGRPMGWVKALAGRWVQADSGGEVGQYAVEMKVGDVAGTVLTMPRPKVPATAQAQPDSGQDDAMRPDRMLRRGLQSMGVIAQDGSGSGKNTGTGDYEGFIPPSQRLIIDLRENSPLTAILRRKLGVEVLR